MAVTAAQVKELRERTGSGLMECKKALVETDGDIEAAIEAMRKSGLIKAGKKAGRVAADGAIFIETTDGGKAVAILEINCETDFVAKGDDFQGFAAKVMARILSDKPASVEELLALPAAAGSAETLDTARQELIAKIGENINVRRFNIIKTEAGQVGGYLHGVRIGVIVEMNGGDDVLLKDVAMHVAASSPVAVSEADVPADAVAKEREIVMAQSATSGKPQEIIEKMVDGRMRKYLAEITLVGQPFVKDPDTTVGKLLDKAGASVVRFTRFEVGEGIEKKEENFAEEVMAQVRGGA
ncbi:MAG: elongation factor Ts [Gammaproteobacteria bacterium]|nr:elongation factor Ts [Gammaproteobacteria bacterium]